MQDVVENIATKTGCSVDQVFMIAGLVMEALHEETVKNERGAGAILTESAHLFGSNVCYHLNGILYEYMERHCPEETYYIPETMLRFIPEVLEQFKPQYNRWLAERSDRRKILDQKDIGSGIKEEEDTLDLPVDRGYWENKRSTKSVKVADECLTILQEVSPTLKLSYRRNYIGLTEQERANNFVLFRAKKQFLRVEVVLTDQEAWSAKLEEAGLEILEGVKARKRMVFRLTSEELVQNHELLREIFVAAYAEQQS